MKVTFLGTAAAEGVPAIWCECPVCAKAIEQQGKDLRRRTSYLIDEDTLIDMGPDTFWQSIAFSFDYRKLDRVIYTHCHGDHISPIEMLWRKDGFFSTVKRNIEVLGSRPSLATIMEYVAKDSGIVDFKDINITPVMLSHGGEISSGDLQILPLRANHALGKEPFIFKITRHGKNILICNDTGFLYDDVLELIEGKRLDMISYDCTMGLKYADFRNGHMGCNVVKELHAELIKRGCIDDYTKCYVTHFSHNGAGLHVDYEAFFKPLNIEVAYDGLVVEV